MTLPTTIAAARTALRDGTVSAATLTEEILAAIGRLDAVLQAFVLVDAEGARAAAAAADDRLAAGDERPLLGVPVAVKDIVDVRGLPTRCGSATYDTDPLPADASVVARLREAGAVLIGKTTAHELACGVYSAPAANPWDPSRIPGGSSGGSGAAVAAGLCLGALGSDTGGSIRIPASVCGIVGLKPTYGVVPTSGVEPLSSTLDHVGPLSPSVADAAELLQVIAGHDPADPTTATRAVPDYGADLDRGIDGMRLGVPDWFLTAAQAAVIAAFETACGHLASLGVELVPIEIPELDHVLAAEFGIIAPEAATYHERRLVQDGDAIDPGIRAILLAGLSLPGTQYVRALQARRLITDAMRRCFADQRLGALVTPTLPATAAGKDQQHFDHGPSEDVTTAYVRTTAPFNLTGQPALSVPCGLDTDGLPIGLQIVGRPHDEPTVLRIGHAYETTTPWHRRQPTIHADRDLQPEV